MRRTRDDHGPSVAPPTLTRSALLTASMQWRSMSSATSLSLVERLEATSLFCSPEEERERSMGLCRVVCHYVVQLLATSRIRRVGVGIAPPRERPTGWVSSLEDGKQALDVVVWLDPQSGTQAVFLRGMRRELCRKVFTKLYRLELRPRSCESSPRESVTRSPTRSEIARLPQRRGGGGTHALSHSAISPMLHTRSAPGGLQLRSPTHISCTRRLDPHLDVRLR
jgi:hypothetical protein